MNLTDDYLRSISINSEKKKGKKRYGSKRNKRAGESSSERNRRNKESKVKNKGVDQVPKFLGVLDINLDLEQRRRVITLLENILKGNNTVHSTPLLKDRSESDIVNGWNKIFNRRRSGVNDVLYNIEMEQLKKIGPRSIALDWDSRKESIYDNFKRHDRRYSVDNTSPYNVELKSLNPISLNNAIDKLKNNTSSGLPYVTKKINVKPLLESEFTSLLNRQDPCLLFTRTQEQLKTRTVWGFPVADTLNEMMYYSPLLEVQRKLSWRSALNEFEVIDQSITKIIDHSISTQGEMLSIDFSAYDSSVSPELQSYAFEYIKALYPDKYIKQLDYIKYRFTNIGLVTPDGILHGPHGVPSGSVFTNEVDSIVQYLISRQSNLTNEDFIQIQGDDGVYSIKSGDHLKLIKEFESAGLTVNYTKSIVSKDYCTYLQNLYHNEYRDSKGVVHGIYPVYRALNRLMYQERFANLDGMGVSGSDYYSIRTISILEGCKYHPLFKELVGYIYSLDKYKLNPSIDGINKFINARVNSVGQEGLIINRPGDVLKGISNFETVKLLNYYRSKDLQYVSDVMRKYPSVTNKTKSLYNLVNNFIDYDKDFGTYLNFSKEKEDYSYADIELHESD